MSRPTSRKRISTNKKPKSAEAEPTVSVLPVSVGLANLLRELDHRLFREFGETGGDFSYVVGGNGKVLAASNEINGIVVPAVKEEPHEGRVMTPQELWQQPSGTVVVHPRLGAGRVERVWRVEDTEWDDRVVIFEGGERFLLPAPTEVEVVPPPWDVAIQVLRPANTEISTAFRSKG